MATYKTTNTLLPEIAGYVAGLIDGEGTITLTRRHANENRQLVVSIANTERQILEFVRDITAVGKIIRKKIASKRHTPSYCYSVSNRQALALLEQIAKHLRSYKFHRATLAIKEYSPVIKRNGKYTDLQLVERSNFERRFLAMRAHTELKT